VPPGQAARMFREGQRLPGDYRYYSELSDIPVDLRNQLPSGSRYIYRENTVYVVDPVTRLVTRIINR
jgi:predicted 2-oxoglutarate/Fe(II)-dependent dioxygenase YbiX